ncbi:MAG: hypothetical protein F6K21_10925 [Symploca sp. SIO2D2]|nr:hypothetical protein [Symploca sp. SIO2D2]
MAESSTTTLLALLLALKQLEIPLSTDEQDKLKTTGQQLELDPDDWDYIKEGLMEVIENNPSLAQLYQTAKVQLDEIDGKISPELLPTEEELGVELLTDGKRTVVYFGYFEGRPDRESDEILNVSINVLRKKDSAKIAKKLSFLERIGKFLQKRNS